MNNDFIFGMRNGWSDPVPFGINLEDQRQHVYVIGKTGSGKSTLLRNIIIQAIDAGLGVGLIDPHGQLAEEILDYIPSRRADDLVYFNAGDSDFPIGFNVLGNLKPEERHLAASGIVQACKAIWHESWGPRLEYILHNSIIALMHCENATLLGINRLLSDKAYRDWVVRQIDDPFNKSFWLDEFENYDPRFQREVIAPIQNKVGQFIANPIVRNIVGQVKTKISIPFTMNNSRLFIANLCKGKIGNDKAHLLGSLLVSQFYIAAMARHNIPEAERKDFICVIDEFQNFGTEIFADILSEARKYRLSLVLSHQFVEQLPLITRQSVFGNVGTLISFRTGHSDAEILKQEFGNQLPASAFVGLDRFEVLVRLLENGSTKEGFRGSTVGPLGKASGRRKKLVRHCRTRFAAEKRDVEEKLNRWATNGF